MTREQASRRRRLLPAAAVLVAVVAGGCQTTARPNLGRLYRSWASREQGRRPVIVIHGLMGSRLVDRRTGKVVWGGVRGLLGGGVGDRLALPLQGERTPDLEARGFVDEIAGVDVYGGILRTLEAEGGYLREDRQTPPYRRATCFPFFYDWRLDNAANAAQLAERIEEIRGLYGEPNLKVDIVAHSMGGLIARYYLLYGGRDVLDDPEPRPDFAGAAAVGKLVLLGTPSLGSADALKACIEGDRVGLTRIWPEVLATMPSMYQLMPDPEVPALYTADGRPAPVDIYDPAVWKARGWGIFDPRFADGIRRRYHARHPGATDAAFAGYRQRLARRFAFALERARAFHRALNAAPPPASVKVILLGGDCTPTPRAFLMETENGRLVVRFEPAAVRRPPPGIDVWALYFEPGDGTVTKSSLLAAIPAGTGGASRTALPNARAIFICEVHRKLVRSPTFQDNLLHALLYQPISAGEACRLAPAQASSPSSP